MRYLFAISLLLLTLRPEDAAALSQSFPAGLPWDDRIARDGIELQVDFDPAGALRQRDRVAFRFRIVDESGKPISGLQPAAWMQPLEGGKTVDPLACVEEVETEAGWKLVRAPVLLDLDLQERKGSGIYEASARMGSPGRYEVAFFLGAPRLIHCFEVEVRSAG